MGTTTKASTQENLTSLALGSSAAATILLPQAITKAMPQAFAGIAPITAQALPYCTGVCGSCGGSCVGALTTMLFLAFCTKAKVLNSK
ncbi:hypothetical protein [Phascolarctobacterium succinatutens]|uniref:hypothetical protein n=1 Tax=Phascolarctobacterium succinatutens TaxID=626940 RepID=UPI0026F087E9|nr:hypothetical protein [Phascolarctobacterium succinatutens]